MIELTEDQLGKFANLLSFAVIALLVLYHVAIAAPSEQILEKKNA